MGHHHKNEVQPGGRYALRVPPHCLISIRGLELMVEDYTKYYEAKPVGIILSDYQMQWLCREAARNGRMLADEVAGTLPEFMGIPVDTFDGEEFGAQVIDREE